MSLFGSSPEDPVTTDKTTSSAAKSLFKDDRRQNNSSLFDDSGESGPSPWDLPTPKKASKNDAVKTLLSTSDVPESYIDTYDLLLESGYKTASETMSLPGVRRVVEGTELEDAEKARILTLVGGDRGSDVGFGRSEFNVLLALLGLSQEREEATLDGVDERRKNLPEPSLPIVKQLRSLKVSDNVDDTSPPRRDPATLSTNEALSSSNPPKSRRLRRDSLENLDADPWGSPALHKGHTHAVQNESTPSSNAITAIKPIGNEITGPSRTTSTFTTRGDNQPSTVMSTSDNTGENPTIGSDGGWASYVPGSQFPSTSQSGLGNGGFGSNGDDQQNRSRGRSLGGGQTNHHALEELVTVNLLPDKEGVFLFQHRNYEVTTFRKNSTVVRRYSDFVWLLDCLHKRYPFRQLPLLPPKRVAVNGRHLSADVTFVEKRRRGLVRFANALVRHPVLSQEQLVTMFFIVPTELAVWRKQATISVQEEFTGKPLPSGLEDSLPTNLLETFDSVRSGVRRSSDTYVGLCGLLERLVKRNQGIATDYLRFSHALLVVTEATESTYATDTTDVAPLNEGINSTAKHLTVSQTLLEDEARAWDEGVLEDFKYQRDTLVAIRDMFDRRDRYARDNIPQLERRIENNEKKLAGLMERADGATNRPGEQEKLEQALRADKQSIIDQHARGVLIKECIRDELVFFQRSQYHVSKLHQEWSQERVKYAELQANNWRTLSEEVETMPQGE